jgi:hypothetical protein
MRRQAYGLVTNEQICKCFNIAMSNLLRFRRCLKFLYEALVGTIAYDQAACISDALAWSFAQSRVFDPPCVFDATWAENAFARKTVRPAMRLRRDLGGKRQAILTSGLAFTSKYQFIKCCNDK